MEMDIRIVKHNIELFKFFEIKLTNLSPVIVKKDI
jgi:hypothetical protein